MAFLHCHNCYWEQDDFWDEDYNPITFLEKNFKKELLSKDLDEFIGVDYDILNGYYFVKSITLTHVDDDLEDAAFREWPELLTRSQVAKFLGVTPKYVSTLSKRGYLRKCVVEKKTYWRLEDVQVYAQKRTVGRPKDKRGRFI